MRVRLIFRFKCQAFVKVLSFELREFSAVQVAGEFCRVFWGNFFREFLSVSGVSAPRGLLGEAAEVLDLSSPESTEI